MAQSLDPLPSQSIDIDLEFGIASIICRSGASGVDFMFKVGSFAGNAGDFLGTENALFLVLFELRDGLFQEIPGFVTSSRHDAGGG